MLPRLVGVWLVALILVACGGGDDDDGDNGGDANTQPPATATARPADAPTAPAGATVTVAQPTTTVEAATATVPDQTTTATEPAGIDPDQAEQQLFDMLLTVDDLGPDFTQLNRDSQMDEGTSGEAGLCNVPPFDQYETRIANVQADFQDAGPTRYLLQDIILFPDAVVDDALEHARSTLACTTFTDESTDYTLTPIDDPALENLGDEAFGASVVASGEPQVVHLIYMRVGMVLTGLSYVDAAGASNPSASLPAALQLAERAADRIASAQ